MGGILEEGAVGNICGFAAYWGREEREPPLREYGLLILVAGFSCGGCGGVPPLLLLVPVTAASEITGNEADCETGELGAVD